MLSFVWIDARDKEHRSSLTESGTEPEKRVFMFPLNQHLHLVRTVIVSSGSAFQCVLLLL